MRTIFARALVTLAVLLVSAACDDRKSTTSLTPPHVVSAYDEQGDSVYWEDNKLEFTDDNGDNWRFERDQPDATEVSLFRNDSLVAEYGLEWSGSEVTTLIATGPTTSGWSESDTTGAITDTSWGTGGGSGPCGGGGVCQESHDCTEEWNDLLDSGNTAIGAGVVAMLTAEIPGVNVATASGFALATGVYIGDLVSYGMCRVT